MIKTAPSALGYFRNQPRPDGRGYLMAALRASRTMNLETLKTPSLVLDVAKVKRNAERMSQRIRQFGADLRPHIKTHKCIEVARIQTAGHSGAVTVSTLAEARAFAANGFSKITYAIPIEPGKFNEAIELSRDCELSLITDDLYVPDQLNTAAKQANVHLDLFLKVDCGYHRCGVEPTDRAATEIPRRISNASNLRFAGILTHAGHSYNCQTRAEVLALAKHERDVMAGFAETLRKEVGPAPIVSIGSTPTITTVDHLDGIDEVRPGNYIFFDAFQATLGSCSFEDCALTVLASVVHRADGEEGRRKDHRRRGHRAIEGPRSGTPQSGLWLWQSAEPLGRGPESNCQRDVAGARRCQGEG
jgi:D-serine deaminase-like pyridoxal phosphate-dependent protein